MIEEKSGIVAQTINKQFKGIFNSFGITKRDLEKAEDDLDLPEISRQEVALLGDTGIDMSEARKDIDISGTKEIFSYKKRPVVVYIKDQYLNYQALSQKKYNKYHLCYCAALKKADEEKRFYNRYVMVRRTKGDFWIGVYEKDTEYMLEEYAYRKLNICQDCLRQLDWKGFSKYCGSNPNNWWQSGDKLLRQQIVDNFSIGEFLRVMRKELREEMSQQLKGRYLSQQ